MHDIDLFYAKLAAARTKQKEAADCFVREFPVGSHIRKTHGDGHISLEVVEHSYTAGRHYARVKVRGSTGREYWIDADRSVSSAERKPL